MWYTKCVIMWDAKCVIVLQNFDRYHCCQLVLECLCQYDDASVIQMSIAICGILAAKVNTLIYLDIDGAWRTCVWPLSICQFVNTCNLGLRDHVTPALNRFCTEQGHCGAYRRKWRLTDTDVCPYVETQTMFHIVESCPLTELNGSLSQLHSADEDAVSWLTSYGSWHAYEKKKKTGYLSSTESNSSCVHWCIKFVRGAFCDDALYRLTFTFTLVVHHSTWLTLCNQSLNLVVDTIWGLPTLLTT